MRLLNSSHRGKCNPYYEWWYFDFISDQGDIFNIVIHETDIFGQSDISSYSISLLLKGHSAEYVKGAYRGFKIKRSSRFLRIKKPFFIENKLSISFKMLFENDLVVSGKIYKDKFIKLSSDGLLYRFKKGFGMWIPWFIAGKFYLDLERGEKKTHLEGKVYHDHQWGNLPIQQKISDWVWGHFNGENESIVIFKIITNDGDVIEKYYIDFDGKSVSGVGGIETKMLLELSKTQNIYNFNQECRLKLRNEDLSLDFSIKKDDIVRCRLLEKVQDKTFSYCRWASIGYCDVKGKRRNICGVFEYMRFR